MRIGVLDLWCHFLKSDTILKKKKICIGVHSYMVLILDYRTIFLKVPIILKIFFFRFIVSFFESDTIYKI